MMADFIGTSTVVVHTSRVLHLHLALVVTLFLRHILLDVSGYILTWDIYIFFSTFGIFAAGSQFPL